MLYVYCLVHPSRFVVRITEHILIMPSTLLWTLIVLVQYIKSKIYHIFSLSWFYIFFDVRTNETLCKPGKVFMYFFALFDTILLLLGNTIRGNKKLTTHTTFLRKHYPTLHLLKHLPTLHVMFFKQNLSQVFERKKSSWTFNLQYPLPTPPPFQP